MFTRTSGPSQILHILENICATSAELPASPGTASQKYPSASNCFLRSYNAVTDCLQLINTKYPARAKRNAQARPIPRDAPVINMDLFPMLLLCSKSLHEIRKLCDSFLIIPLFCVNIYQFFNHFEEGIYPGFPFLISSDRMWLGSAGFLYTEKAEHCGKKPILTD